MSLDGFSGLRKTCVRFKRAKGGVYRCAEYKKKGQRGWPGAHPKACGPGLISRSPGLIRKRKCSEAPRYRKVRGARRRRY